MEIFHLRIIETTPVSHTDKKPDLGYQSELLSEGVNFRVRLGPASGDRRYGRNRVALERDAGGGVLVAADAGHGRGASVTVADARRGAGPRMAATEFPKVLPGYRIDDAMWRTLMVGNPARFLSFEP